VTAETSVEWPTTTPRRIFSVQIVGLNRTTTKKEQEDEIASLAEQCEASKCGKRS
jgi:hypothetical protein